MKCVLIKNNIHPGNNSVDMPHGADNIPLPHETVSSPHRTHRMQRGEDGEDLSYLHTVVDLNRTVAVVQLNIGQRPSFGRPTGSELDAILAFLDPIQEHP